MRIKSWLKYVNHFYFVTTDFGKHHIPQATNIPYHINLVDQTHIQRTRPRRKTVFFKTSLRAILVKTVQKFRYKALAN